MFPERDANLGEPIIEMVEVDPSNPKLCENCYKEQSVPEPCEIPISSIGQVKTRGGTLCLHCAYLGNYFARIGWRLWIGHVVGQLRYCVSYNINGVVPRQVMCAKCRFDGVECVPVTQKECKHCKDAGVTCAIVLPNSPERSGYSSELANGII